MPVEVEVSQASGWRVAPIAYRIVIPQRVDALLVPVAASTTHAAYSSIRMEPTWMALGQAASVAAHLVIQNNLQPCKVPLAELQSALEKQGQVLRHAEKSM